MTNTKVNISIEYQSMWGGIAFAHGDGGNIVTLIYFPHFFNPVPFTHAIKQVIFN